MGTMETIIGAVELYAAFGLVFAAFFLTVGVGRIDSAARGTHFGFRLLILPGVVALWPILFVRMILSRPGGPG